MLAFSIHIYSHFYPGSLFNNAYRNIPRLEDKTNPVQFYQVFQWQTFLELISDSKALIFIIYLKDILDVIYLILKIRQLAR